MFFIVSSYRIAKRFDIIDSRLVAEAIVFQTKRRIVRSKGRFRKRDLFEIRIGLAPETGAPALIELIDVLIFFFQIGNKSLLTAVTVTDIGPFVTKLVIDLPGNDGFFILVVIRQLFRQSDCL